MAKKFKQAGWVLDRVQGSHHIFKKNGHTWPIPVHGNKDLPKGTEAACLKKLKEVG